jgi:catechol 2,3-dioxygenase-like lactoylglutathione lyase family enzyme
LDGHLANSIHDAAPVKLALVAVVVRDYDEAIEWYTTALGFEVREDTVLSETKRWVVVGPPGGEAAVLLAKAAGDEQEARVGDQTGGRVGFFLHVDDFAATHERLVAAGGRLVRGPDREPYGTVGVCEDLYGNLWDLIERSDG